MKINRLEAFAGLPFKLKSGISVYSPRIKEILEIGENEYHINLILSSFDKQRILIDLFGLPPVTLNEVEHVDSFDLLADHAFAENICSALSFFVKDDVVFKDHCFMVGDNVLCSKDNYVDVASIIKQLNGSSEDNEAKIKPKNERTKRFMAKLNSFRKQSASSDDGLDLKDMLSILCNAEGNGLNIFNIFDLTVYQAYEHFERLSMKENHARLLPIWANGRQLREDQQLPEWIKKSKL